MKARRGFLWKLAVCSVLFCSVFLISGKRAQAAEQWVKIRQDETPVGGEGPSVKAGGYYLWCGLKYTGSEHVVTVYRSKEENMNGKKVYTAKSRGQNLYTNGKKLFIVEDQSKKDGWHAKAVIKNLEGSKKTKTVMDKRGRAFHGAAVCGDTFYFAYSKSTIKNVFNIYETDYTTYAMKIGKKAVKKVLKGYIPVKAGRTYLIVQDKKSSYFICNLKTRKCRKLVSKTTSPTFFLGDTDVYVVDNSNDLKVKTYTFYRKQVKGNKKTKKLGSFKDKAYISVEEINSKRVTYWKSSKLYEYNFKTKKTRRVS